MPAGSKILPFRSNIPKMSEFCFTRCDEQFPSRAKAWDGGIIVGGQNYGQGSSREHAALVPLYLGVKAVIAKSFARIHAANLINSGILPFTFENDADYDALSLGDELEFTNLRTEVLSGKETVFLKNKMTGTEIPLRLTLSERQRRILAAGGLLNATKEEVKS